MIAATLMTVVVMGASLTSNDLAIDDGMQQAIQLCDTPVVTAENIMCDMIEKQGANYHVCTMIVSCDGE